QPCWPFTTGLEAPRQAASSRPLAKHESRSISCARACMRTREAVLPDAERIHQLISNYSGDGTLLPRSFAEICENVRDFLVLEDAGRVVGCGALHLYGLHLADIGSITVDPEHQGSGCGMLLLRSLLSQAKKHAVTCICLFTRKPEFFSKLRFS